MTIFMRFHQSSLHCEESIALQRKKLKRSVREVTPATPQKFQQAMKIDNPATKRPPRRHITATLNAPMRDPGRLRHTANVQMHGLRHLRHTANAPCIIFVTPRIRPMPQPVIPSQASRRLYTRSEASDLSRPRPTSNRKTLSSPAQRGICCFFVFCFSRYESSTRSVTAATCAISATSCTRTMCAPPRMLAATVAAVAKSRSSDGTGFLLRSVASSFDKLAECRARSSKAPSLARASVWPRNPLREVPTRSG
jgi:hypothetical protein